MMQAYREQLLQVIGQARRRWRRRIVLRSIAVLVGAAVATVLAAAAALEYSRFSPLSILTARAGTYSVFVALGWYLFIRPLRVRVTDVQVAMYLEEHEPSLGELLVSAVDAGAQPARTRRPGESQTLLDRLVEQALDRCRQPGFGHRLERRSVRRSATALAATAVLALAVFSFGPPFLRQGARAVLVPTGSAEAASPYRIDVSPGSVTVARGSAVVVRAELRGFSSAAVDVFQRTESGQAFERTPMAAVADASANVFEWTMGGVRASTDYFVQAAGVRSRVFRIEAADLPYVGRVRLEYRFPAYTGLEPAVEEQGGDIAAVAGTRVRVQVHSTMATSGGRIVIDEREPVMLTPDSGTTLSGEIQVKTDGTYRIELADASGQLVQASPPHVIDAIEDGEPTVTFGKPARDVRATSIDEVYVEAEAEDAYGIAALTVVYAVNGGPEATVRVGGGGAPAPRRVSAGHTFFLEELGLQPGDAVSYYARATDTNAVGGPASATSDIFFVQIQPFRKDYRAAESQAGGQPGGQGQGGAGDTSALSEQQRRIVSGTFNLARDRARAGEERYRQDVVFLALTQGQLRERARTLAGQIRARVVSADPLMTTIAGHLGDAASAMERAERALRGHDASGALPAEQQALASLQRAEEAYRDVRVRMEQQQGGGGGGGQNASVAADELADLFQLEMDKLRNQYETFQRSRQQAGDNKVDEMLERLRELARRQEQEAERQRQAGGSRQGTGSASGARQRQLAEEAEEAARQLERLSRDEGRQELAETARGLRQAAEAMRRAAAGGDAAAFAQAQAAAARVEQARDRLGRQRADRLAQRIDEARAQVRRIDQAQAAIEGDTKGLAGAAGAARREQAQRMQERTDGQLAEVGELERQIDQTAIDFRRERPQAAQAVQEAADAIRDRRLRDKIRYSRGLVHQGAAADAAAELHAQIRADLAAVATQLDRAAGLAGERGRDSTEQVLAQARGLVQGVESMGDRRGGQPRQPGSADGGVPAAGIDPRQVQREARERRRDAEVLRRELRALGVDARDLDALIAQMRELEGMGVGDDPAETERLQLQLAEGFRRFEFDLRRRLGVAAEGALLLPGTEELPAGYRRAVEAYYRALARDRK